MDKARHISTQNPSISRGQNGRNSRRDDPVDNKDVTNRRKCPDCDGRLSKESTKSKSRVWKRVMWFTRRNKAPKNDICQCQTTDGFIDPNVEDRHSNSWSFTRCASRKFRISSRKRQCKSESSKKSVSVQGKQDEACPSHESSLASTRRVSLCSSGANSPTATGSFCDFGASSHSGGKRGSKRHKNTFVLTEIAREINPPVRNDDLRLSNIHHPRKQLTKSSSSVSHLPRSPMTGNVHRSKSFPGSQSCMSPPKRHFTSTPNTAFVTSSPPLKQRCYGLRRTATFCGKLNTEFPKLSMKKSKSVNNGELMRHGKSSSLGEIRDQSGSIVGIVHFYKSPIKLARKMSSLNWEVKKDCMFEEEEYQCPTVDRTNIAQESSGTCLKTESTTFESRCDASLLPESFCVNEASLRNYEEPRKGDNTKNCSSFPPLEEISKSVIGAEDLLCFSNVKEEIHDDSKSTLCNTEPLVLTIDEPVQESSCFDHKDGLSNINAGGSNHIDVNKGEVSVLNVTENSKNNYRDSASGYSHTDLLGSFMKNQGAVSKNANNVEDLSECEPSSTKDESLSTPLPSEDEVNNISSLQMVSKTSEDDSSSAGSDHELLTKLPSSVASQQCSENIESENSSACNDLYENQLQPELQPSLPTSEQMSEDGDLLCCFGDHALNNCQVCDHSHRNNLETELLSSVSVTLKQNSEDLKSLYQDNDSVLDNCNENELSASQVDRVSPMSHQGSKDFELETNYEIVSSQKEHHDFTNTTPKFCSANLHYTCIENPSLPEESEDSFCGYNESQSKTSADHSLEEETSVDGSACFEIIEDSAIIDGACEESNDINCGKKCLQNEVDITEPLDSSTAPGKRDLAFFNDAKFCHECPCVMCEDDLTLEVFDDQFSCNNVAVPNEKFQTHVHSSMIPSSELKSSCPTISINSASDLVDLCNESETNILSSQNWENSRNLAIPAMDREVFKVRCHSSTSSSEVLECSRTSEYVSLYDESFSAPQSDVPIHTWKTSETDLKSDEIGLPVPGETFKKRTELMLSWFEEFNDEQRNIILKKILNRCELPQMHLLSVAMENNLHKTCPPNCQDMLVWLPYTVSFKILTYLDPVSLCRCNQVNRAWNELTDNSLLWQRLTRSPDYQLSEASGTRQYQKFTHGNGEIHWKKVFAERFLLQRNWLNGKYKLRTFEGHNQGIACVQFDDTRIVSGSSDKTIKLWDISNTPSELMLTLEGHSGTVRCLDLNGNRLVSGSTDRTIKVWDLSFASYWAGASCKVTMVGHLHTVRCLQADERKLVSGSYDKTVKVWDLKNGECRLTLRGHTAAVLCVQFDDQKIVSGSYDKKIKVWDLSEGTCLMTLDGHQDAVTCLNLTHDGMKIITGSLDYSLKFWDLSTGKCYGTLDWITSEGHTAVVRCLQVDSWRIVSGGDDKTLKVWELATGQRLLTLRYHSDGVTCMQFNDFAIVSGSYDRTVKLWDFTPKHSYLEAAT